LLDNNSAEADELLPGVSRNKLNGSELKKNRSEQKKNRILKNPAYCSVTLMTAGLKFLRTSGE